MRTILFLIFILAVGQAQAATNTAASVASAAVQTAIDASANGDTVLIPAGAATWTSVVTVDGKGIYLRGAGTNLTIITINIANSSANAIDFVNLTAAMKAGVSDLQMVGGTGEYAAISMGSAGTTNISVWTISNVLITNLSKRGIKIYNGNSGLIHHCLIISPVSGTGISPEGSDVFSSNQWNTAFSPNTTNQTLIEDCDFQWLTAENNGIVDSYSGSTWTLRYCRTLNGNLGGHGTDSSDTLRSMKHSILHHNSMFNSAAVNVSTLFQFRGGMVLSYSNTIWSSNGSTHGYVRVDNYRNTGTNSGYSAPAGPICCNPWGPVTGTNRMDGNSNAFGWPALDQTGRSGPTTYGATNVSQAYQPAYAWTNLFIRSGATTDVANFVVVNNPANTGPYSYISRTDTVLQEGRDFFSYTPMPGYSDTLTYPDARQGGPDLGAGGSTTTVTNAVSVGGGVTIGGGVRINQ